ncbi:multidrug efflux RND transporter permease subunit [Anaeromyxobacter diazotrophicus]|uniref:Acriflavine resistance protein B n=1 Tax=Anaeromyxobacter diazotrophicus TaxID=2590199 RepID=A0A7I9VLV2_9BACT|nr:multidrug efflux RND transporter permease subunit [Anaeromyxobacter diazotrophicus]GEJ57110.1 acriflavine resistance protein B [Anaeromyxobacter diazotrophicus]
MSISEPFIRRPVATTLLAAALLLAGAAAYTQLPVSPLPRVDFPTVNVSAGLPGASPETMASSVATPLERRFGRIAGLSEITSVSSLGSTSLTLQFDLDRDVDAAARDVQAAINASLGDLPAGLPVRPNFRKVNPADAPIMILAVSSETLPLSRVFDTANTVLAQKISQVEGVGQVFVGGGQQPAVRIQVDPAALAGAGLSTGSLRTTIGAATANAPKGSLDGPEQAHAVAADDQLLNAAAWQPLIVGYANGSPVRLRDVARVVDSVENTRVAGWVDGRRAVVMIVRRQPGANIIEVIERVKALLPQLTSAISPAIKVELALDRSTTIRASVRDVQLTLFLSVGLVVLVVFLFLRSARATVIPSVAVPLAIVATFGGMYLLGYSLDNLSLMALTISTGFVVDDAIVVTENVTRFVEAGEPPMQAALKGAKQIGFTIVSITASLLAVFIPILLMGGVVGRLFREFAVTLSIAIAVSAVISLTLTPMMASRLLAPRSTQRRGALYRASERFFDGMLHGYERGLRWVLDHHGLMLAVTVAAAAVSVWLYVVVPKGLFPQQDTGQVAGISDAPQDISFPAMRARQELVNQVVMAHPAVDHMVSFIGGGTINNGNAFIQLKPKPPRRQTADQVIGELRPKLAQVPGIQLFLQSVQDVRVGGRVARTQYQYTLQDANLAELNAWAPRMVEKLKTLPELRDVASDQQTSALELRVDVDRDTAARLGITPQAVDDALYDAFGQRQVATTFTQLNQYRVVLEMKPELAQHPDALSSIYVPTPGGGQVPLSSIARWTPGPTSLSVNHQGQFPAVTLSFNLAPGVALGQALTAVHRAEQQIGLPASIRAAPQGTAQAFVESLRSEPWLVLAALIAVYIVLGVLYESYVHPVTILSTLPSAGVGALVALIVMRTEFSIIALIGVILLIGIVKKNAIMMIDFAIEAERDEGLSTRDAIYRACMLRFRPIMMTTLAALLGALPLAFGGGAGAELRRPLGITIVGGLVFSQALTLFTTPVVYLALDRFTRRRQRPVSPRR